MTSSISIDSSVFLSGLTTTDPSFAVSKAFLKKIVTGNILIIVPVLVLFEVLHAYFRNTKDLKKTDEVFQNFIDLNIEKKIRFINIEADFLSYFVARHYEIDLKTLDSVIALVAQKNHCPLVTWDKKLLKNCKGKIQTMTPAEFLRKRTIPVYK
jgi:predicted nucleic acid-binding protein